MWPGKLSMQHILERAMWPGKLSNVYAAYTGAGYEAWETVSAS